jgi:hypothetical protein
MRGFGVLLAAVALASCGKSEKAPASTAPAATVPAPPENRVAAWDNRPDTEKVAAFVAQLTHDQETVRAADAAYGKSVDEAAKHFDAGMVRAALDWYAQALAPFQTRRSVQPDLMECKEGPTEAMTDAEEAFSAGVEARARILDHTREIAGQAVQPRDIIGVSANTEEMAQDERRMRAALAKAKRTVRPQRTIEAECGAPAHAGPKA